MFIVLCISAVAWFLFNDYCLLYRYPENGRLPSYPVPTQPPPYPYPANGSPLGSPPGYTPGVPGVPGATEPTGGSGLDRKKRVEFAEPLIQDEETVSGAKPEPEPEIKEPVSSKGSKDGYIGSIFPRLTGSSQTPEVDPSKKIYFMEFL